MITIKTPHPLRALSAIGFAVLLLATPSALAEVKTWNTGDGTWQTGANWAPTGAPASTDGVNIFRPTDQEQPFTIDFTGDATVTRLFLGISSNGVASSTPVQTTLDLTGGHKLSITGTSSSSLAFGATNGSGDVSLTITGGTVEALNLRIWGTAGTTSTSYLYITGSAAVLNTRNLTGGQNSFIGSNSPGEVHVTGGASYITGSSERTNVGAAGGANGNGKLFIQGVGSNYSGNYNTFIAWGGTGQLEVSGGGSFSEGTFNMAGVDNTLATTLISGTGSSFAATNVNIGTQAYFPGVDAGSGTNRVGTLTVADGATATAGLLNLRGSLSTLALDGSTMTVTGNNNATLSNSAAFFDADATLRMTLDSTLTPAALQVTNRLQITGAALDILLSGTFSVSLDDVFTVANYGALTGTFAGLNQNATFAVGAQTFQIDYGSGVNDAITLTSVVPEPSITGLLLGATAALALVRRRSGNRSSAPLLT